MVYFMAEVKRKKGESFDALLRRFSKKMMLSGRLLQAKKIRYFTKEKSRNLKKQSALRRMKISDHREYLKRIGKLPEEEMNQKNQKKRSY
jgi:ribosomal protein S21